MFILYVNSFTSITQTNVTEKFNSCAVILKNKMLNIRNIVFIFFKTKIYVLFVFFLIKLKVLNNYFELFNTIIW